MKRNPTPSGGRSSGQALVMALLVLVLTSFTCLLLAAEISRTQRMGLEELERAQLRALVDAGVAEAAASLAAGSWYSGGRRELAGGTVEIAVETVSPGLRRVEVTARVRGRSSAAEAEFELTPGGARVRYWARLTPG